MLSNLRQALVALAKELGISRRLLYTWREQREPVETPEGHGPQRIRVNRLCGTRSRLKRVLAEKVRK